MSTFDDYDGVYFSIQAIRMYHAEVIDQLELLVIDNNPTGPCANALKSLESSIDNYRYVPVSDTVGCIARDFIFSEANSDFVMVMDCHVLMLPDSLRQLIEYFDSNPDSDDLVQGPLVHDDLNTVSTHFDPIWKGGNFGTWGTDSRGLDPAHEPFDIPMQGCGVFACRRATWPGFNLRFRGFGAEEGYIHEKFRQRGGRTLCAPFLRWTHRFNRPFGTPYPHVIADGMRNYSIGWQELGLDLAPVRAHFSSLLGRIQADEIFARVNAEIQSPLFIFDTVFFLHSNDPERIDDFTLSEILNHIHISERVVRIVPVVEATANKIVQRLLAYRDIAQRAVKSRAQTVLVIERIDAFTPELQQNVGRSGKKLVAGTNNSFIFPSPEHTGKGNKTEVDAIAINETTLARLARQLPESADSAVDWLSEHGSLESFLSV